jgi:acid stress-induced BolA-like protein IbaG/YrbA
VLTEQIKRLVEAGLPDCEIRVETDGYKYHVVAIGDHFAGLSPVKRQQAVYGCITHLIADGTLHAVTMQTFTRDEWQHRQA